MTKTKLYLCLTIMLFLIVVIGVPNRFVTKAQGGTPDYVEYDLTTGAVTYGYGSTILPQSNTALDGYTGTDPVGTSTDQEIPDGSTFRGSPNGDGHPTNPHHPDPGGRIVGSTDDRKPVNGNTSFPGRTFCQITSTFPNGDIAHGSGVLIGRQYVLTAGHVVNDLIAGNAKEIKVTPGRKGDSKPYGTFKVLKYRLFNQFIQSGNGGYDIAVLALDQPIGNRIGWLGLVYYTNVVGLKINVVGYPLDKDSNRPGAPISPPRYAYRSFGQTIGLNAVNKQLVNHDADATAGQSGGPAYTYNSSTGRRRVTGVHKGNSPDILLNVVAYFDAFKYKQVSDWIINGF